MAQGTVATWPIREPARHPSTSGYRHRSAITRTASAGGHAGGQPLCIHMTPVDRVQSPEDESHVGCIVTAPHADILSSCCRSDKVPACQATAGGRRCRAPRNARWVSAAGASTSSISPISLFASQVARQLDQLQLETRLRPSAAWMRAISTGTQPALPSQRGPPDETSRHWC